MLKRRRDLIKFVVLLLFIAAVIVVGNNLGLYDLLSLEGARELASSYSSGGLVFASLYAVLTILLVPGTPLTIASGILFGKWLGTLYSIIGASLGGIVAFSIARYLGEDFIERFLKNKYKKIYEWDKKIEENGLLVVLFLRVIPIFPFTILNYALGLTKVKFRHYLIGTVLGIIPGVFVLAFLGDSVVGLNVVNIIVSIVLFALLILVWPIYLLYKKKKQ